MIGELKITQQSTVRPPRIFVYGIEGIGKTTFGAGCPNPIFLPAEDGIGVGKQLASVRRLPRPAGKDDVIKTIRALAASPAKYNCNTFVIDTADALDRILATEVCKESGVDSLERAAGGYGKGNKRVDTYWKTILQELDSLIAANVMVVILGHTSPVEFVDPEAGAYNRWVPRMDRKLEHGGSLIVEWADIVGFAHRPVKSRAPDGTVGISTTTGPGKTKSIPQSSGSHQLRLVGTPAVLAKNRYSVGAETCSLDWPSLAALLFS